MIRVALVDDHALIRQGLWRAIERTRDMTAVGEARTVAEAEAVVRHVKPDVAVVDIRLPDGNGLELCRTLRRTGLVETVVILSMSGDDSSILGAREAGATAFVSKDSPASEVIAAIRTASQAPRAFFAEGLADAEERNALTSKLLTPREMEVLALIAEGLSVAGISERLFVSDSTTKTHLSKIYAKLGARNRTQAVMTALDLGLIDREGSA
jgi:DNA-binding NarL/FixJ family response regulator